MSALLATPNQRHDPRRLVFILSATLLTTVVVALVHDLELVKVLIAYYRQEPTRCSLGLVWAQASAFALWLPIDRMRRASDGTQWYAGLIALFSLIMLILVGLLHTVQVVQQLPEHSTIYRVMAGYIGGMGIVAIAWMVCGAVLVVEGAFDAYDWIQTRRLDADVRLKKFLLRLPYWVLSGGLDDVQARRLKCLELDGIIEAWSVGLPTAVSEQYAKSWITGLPMSSAVVRALARLRDEIQYSSPQSPDQIFRMCSEMDDDLRTDKWHRLAELIRMALVHQAKPRLATTIVRKCRTWRRVLVEVTLLITAATTLAGLLATVWIAVVRWVLPWCSGHVPL